MQVKYEFDIPREMMEALLVLDAVGKVKASELPTTEFVMQGAVFLGLVEVHTNFIDQRFYSLTKNGREVVEKNRPMIKPVFDQGVSMLAQIRADIEIRTNLLAFLKAIMAEGPVSRGDWVWVEDEELTKKTFTIAHGRDFICRTEVDSDGNPRWVVTNRGVGFIEEQNYANAIYEKMMAERGKVGA